jgi:biotin carboxyl carrier protein
MVSRIVAMLVRPGDRIARGAIVARVVIPEVLAAAADVVAADTRAAAWKARQQQLTALREAGLARASDEAEATLALADADAARTRGIAVLLSAGLHPEDAPTLLQTGTVPLKSPVDGIVSDVDVVAGEVVAAGHRLALLVGQGSPARVVARTASPPSGPATLVIGGLRIPLAAGAVVPQVDGADGAREVWFRVREAAEAAAAGSLLVDGAPCSVEVESTTGVVVPARAVVLLGGAAVARRRGETFERATVVVLGHTADGEAVVEGIVAGDEIALVPQAALPESP